MSETDEKMTTSISSSSTGGNIAGNGNAAIDDITTQSLRSAATSDSGFDGAVDEQSQTKANVPPIAALSGRNGDIRRSTAIGTPPLLDTPTHSSSYLNNNVTQSSLGSGTEGLVLYDLTNSSNAEKEFSPHCVKTLMDLKLLGIGFERQRLTFTQVRNELAKRVGDNAATVPTLELSDGTHLQDSWSIANWLANHHPNGSKLFPFPSSKPFAASLNAWGKASFAPNVVALSRPAIHSFLEGDSKTYFEQVKVGKQKLDKMRSMTESERDRQVDQCVSALEPIQAALSAVRESQSSSSSLHPLWLEGGQEPTHADFCVYGWYAHTRTIGNTRTREIWHAHPLVSQWVNGMNAWAGSEITKDFA